MNWLRLDDFDVSNPRLIRGEHDEVVEVQVDCTPNKFDVELCCLARKLIKNGSKAVRYRDLKIEAAPTWLVVTKRRYRCQSCDRTLYQKIPHVDDKHMMTTRLREAVELSAVKRTFADTVHVHGIEPTLATRVFRSYADRMLLNYRYKAPRIFGIDENMLLKGLRGVIVDWQPTHRSAKYRSTCRLERRGSPAPLSIGTSSAIERGGFWPAIYR